MYYIAKVKFETVDDNTGKIKKVQMILGNIIYKVTTIKKNNKK